MPRPRATAAVNDRARFAAPGAVGPVGTPGAEGMPDAEGATDAVAPGRSAVEWSVAPGPVPYPQALAAMEERVAGIRAGRAPERVWLLEHPPLYTAGTSARPEELLAPGALPVFRSGRGGRYTYHGPGQRVAYVMLDLAARGRCDLRRFVRDLEQWLIAALAEFGVAGMRRPGRVGVWVAAAAGANDGDGDAKIAAIGVRVRRWVTFHGVSLNVAPTLAHYEGIVPCGLRGHGVTSLAALGIDAATADVDRALRRHFAAVFGPPPAPASAPASARRAPD